MDRYNLYELAVTDPPRLARFLDAVHGHSPKILREDFSGSGALARYWAGISHRHRSIAVDRDPDPLDRIADTARLTPRRVDVLRARDKADIIATVNFPLGYWHSRASLLKYLRHARACLRPRGILAADTYGGTDAYTPSTTTTRLRTADSTRIDYTWEQRTADPVTARVLNAMHFRVHARPSRGSRVSAAASRRTTPARPGVIRDAFVYDWRLWSIPELVDAMAEAGFRKVEVYHRMGEAIDQDGKLWVRPTDPGDDLGRSWVVYVVGRR